jgi:hypothetical protein
MLPCVNCKREIPEDQVKVIFEVLVCPDCYRVAEILYNRAKVELNNYLVLLKDMIRTSLIAGALQLKKADESEPDVLQRLVHLREFMAGAHALEEPGARLNSCKEECTPPHVRTLAVLGQQCSKPPTAVGTK